MLILVDTRERHPWTFNEKVSRRKLKVGDYSVHGYTHSLRIERKSFGDFVSCVSSQWKRFLRQVNALAHYEFSAVIVEGDLRMLRYNQYRCLTDEDKVLRSIAFITATWGMPIILAGSRDGAQLLATEFMKHSIRKR